MARQRSKPEVLGVLEVLWGLAHAVEARSKWMQRDLGITGPQRLLLRVIGESPGCTPGAAARRLSLNPGTVSRLVMGLERLGLVRREMDQGDRRKQRLLLTRRGDTLSGHRRGTVEEGVRKAIAEGSTIEVRMAQKFIRRLIGSLAVPDTRRAPARSGRVRPAGHARARRSPGALASVR